MRKNKTCIENSAERSDKLEPLIGQITVKISRDGKKWETYGVFNSDEEQRAKDFRKGFLKNNPTWKCCVSFGNQYMPNDLNEPRGK